MDIQPNPEGKLTTILIAAITLVISLAWNDAFKNFFSKSTPFLRKYGPWGYAIGITLLGAVIIRMIYLYDNSINAITEEITSDT